MNHPNGNNEIDEACDCVTNDIDSVPENKSKNWIITSIIMLIFWNQIFGIIMLILSFLMKSDYEANNFKAYLEKQKNLKMLGWIGLILPLVIIAFLPFLITMVWGLQI